LFSALITLGSNEAGELSFGGSVTRVHLWSRVLDFDSEIPMMVVSCHGSEPTFEGLLSRFNGYTELKGKVERLPRSTCGREKRGRREELPLRVENCPQDHFVVTSEREVNVTWPEPEFVSKYPLEKVERNFKQGQVCEHLLLFIQPGRTPQLLSHNQESNIKIT
uniref:Fibronectin type-III domain-containing protein n=1 Tax=Nippostrongylus brasiliensis TaxID=27835 RepID=A0A0N4XNL5_NIPBR